MKRDSIRKKRVSSFQDPTWNFFQKGERQNLRGCRDEVRCNPRHCHKMIRFNGHHARNEPFFPSNTKRKVSFSYQLFSSILV
jgi:hypothetical protein